MTINKDDLEKLGKIFSDKQSRVTILTGAGISAESGIPTFRGPEGYWTIGSKVYMPQEMATLETFTQSPQEVWQWYLYRLGVCLDAKPNSGHFALVKMENYLSDRFSLITQNIDNLHIRAGNTPGRTFQIHGNIGFTRCSNECNDQLYELHDGLKIKRNKKELNDEEKHLLRCSNCNSWLRPHVLWFDEFYDEQHFRFESSLQVANETDLLIIVGTSGATTLPNHIATNVYINGKTIIDINIEEDPFSELAKNSPGGMFIKYPSAKVLPLIAEICQY